MRTFTFCLTFLVAASLPFAIDASELLKVVSWNIANLHHEPGVPLRNRAVPRDKMDYERLRQVVENLDADILALQEIGSPAALGRIIPEEHYHLIVSGRYQPGSELLPPEQRDIFVALAISKKTFPRLPKVRTLDALAIRHLELRDGIPEDRRTRAAMVVEFEWEGLPLKLLAVHLKSFCHE